MEGRRADGVRDGRGGNTGRGGLSEGWKESVRGMRANRVRDGRGGDERNEEWKGSERDGTQRGAVAEGK
jgi:hypothetical protein